MHGLRILVVDDNATNRQILTRQLTGRGVAVTTAQDAAEALQLLKAAAPGAPFDVVLLDLNMPDMDGIELAQAIKADRALRDVVLILLTSSDHAPGFEDSGIAVSLRKPVRQSKLCNAITQQLPGLDAALDRGVSERRETRRPSPTQMAPSGERILVVEDNDINQLLAIRMLEKQGFFPVVAVNGRAALAVLTEEDFSVILMDCQMPEMDGYEATREIRRLEQAGGKKRTAIIAMTANTMQGDRECCIAAGMDDYLSKPLRRDALNDALCRWSADPARALPNAPLSPPAGRTRTHLLDEAVITELQALGHEVLPELVSLYLREAPAQIAELKMRVACHDAAAVLSLTHKLNGGSRSVGAAHLSTVTEELAACARDDRLDSTTELLHRLDAALQDTDRALRGRVATHRT